MIKKCSNEIWRVRIEAEVGVGYAERKGRGRLQNKDGVEVDGKMGSSGYDSNGGLNGLKNQRKEKGRGESCKKRTRKERVSSKVKSRPRRPSQQEQP